MMLTILFLGVFLTGIVSEFFIKKIAHYKGLIISYSVSVVLSLICIHILPELFSNNNQSVIGYYILIGFLIQIFLELLSKGIEHGHIHVHGKINNQQLIIIILGLVIHSLLEGIPLSYEQNNQHIHVHDTVNKNNFSLVYFLMILIHKLPIAAVLMFFLNTLKVKGIKKYSILFIFAVTTPLGAIFGGNLSEIPLFNDWSINFLAISTGMLLHITTLLIFENHNKGNKLKNILTISAGMITGFLLFSF
tara:strand:- start:21552 stop:22295 length:744 start_codon:yes stop_codon:yes gene_type:complete